MAAMTYIPARKNRTKPYAALRLGQGENEGDVDFFSLAPVEHRIALLLQAMNLVIDRCE